MMAKYSQSLAAKPDRKSLMSDVCQQKENIQSHSMAIDFYGSLGLGTKSTLRKLAEATASHKGTFSPSLCLCGTDREVEI